MADICYGTPNMYFLFLAMAVFNLHDNGELVQAHRGWARAGAYGQDSRRAAAGEQP